MQDENKKERADAFRSGQLDLFQSFLCNTVNEHDRLSNIDRAMGQPPKIFIVPASSE